MENSLDTVSFKRDTTHAAAIAPQQVSPDTSDALKLDSSQNNSSAANATAAKVVTGTPSALDRTKAEKIAARRVF